jgi:hypothetical protein
MGLHGHRWVLALAALMVCIGCHVPPPITTTAYVSDDYLTAVCGAVRRSLDVRVDEGPPEFTIAADGVVSRNKDGQRYSVGFFDISEQRRLDPNAVIIVRLDAISSVDPSSRSDLDGAMCAALNPQRDHLVLPQLWREGDDVWRLKIYLRHGKDFPDLDVAAQLKLGKPKGLVDATLTAAIKKAKDDEKAFIYSRVKTIIRNPAPPIQMLGDLVEDVRFYSYQKTPVHEDLVLLRGAAEKIAAMVSTDLPGDKYDAASENVSKQYPVAKEALASLRDDLRALRRSAEIIVDAVDKQDSVTITRRAEEFLVLWSKSFEKDSATTDESCQAAWRSNYHEQPDLVDLWELGTFELPSTPASLTVELPGSGKVVPARSIPVNKTVTAWATYVKTPTGPVSFLWDPGNSTAPDGIKAVAGFLSALASKVPALAAVLKVQGNVRAPAAPCADWACMFDALTTRARCNEARDKVVYPLAPLATYESVARTSATISEGLLRDRTYTISACNGSCVASGANKTSFAQAQAKTPAGVSVSLLGALTYDFRIGSKPSPAFTEFDWRPTAPMGASQQVFALDEVPQPLQSFSTSLLLTVLFPECGAGRFGIGAGPTILYGTGAGALQQWTVNLLEQPPWKRYLTDKIYFTFGGGFRLFNQPLTPVGSTVVIPVTNGTTPAAPAIGATRVNLYPVLQLGFAIDLAVLGDAATAVFGTKVSPPAGSATGAP